MGSFSQPCEFINSEEEYSILGYSSLIYYASNTAKICDSCHIYSSFPPSKWNFILTQKLTNNCVSFLKFQSIAKKSISHKAVACKIDSSLFYDKFWKNIVSPSNNISNYYVFLPHIYIYIPLTYRRL